MMNFFQYQYFFFSLNKTLFKTETDFKASEKFFLDGYQIK
jgi:hypothetical protein